MKKRAIALLAAGHLFDDLNQGVIPALIPFFVSERGFTIAAAAGLVFASNISSSILQPLFGLLADRRSAPWLVPAGLFLAGAGVAAAELGACPSNVRRERGEADARAEAQENRAEA